MDRPVAPEQPAISVELDEHWQCPGRTLEKARAVVQAAEREPARFSHLVTEMDRTGKVTGVYRKLSVARDEDRIFALAPAPGKFRTLVIDPPWKYEGLFFGRGGPDYAAMSQDELLELPVADWAEDNSHLYLWTTNTFLFRAGELLDRWGFEYANILTWTKPHFGMGIHFRNSTEHVLFATRGRLATRRDDIGTHFEAPLGKHSEKPERFYEIVRAASYPPYGEAFQRQPRPDFVNLYAEAPPPVMEAAQ
jgi:N6-adenosine-specific RNA methylase IME4